jgi:hypothetical protein
LEPFRIVCPTCRSKLVIRHDWLLGKSIHCPRCKAVLALPTSRPNSSQLLEASLAQPISYDSSAITRVDDGTLAKHVAETLQSPNEDLASLDDFAIASAVEAYRASNHDSLGRPVESGRSQGLDQTENVAQPSVEWPMQANQRRRQVLMIGMAAIAGILLAAAGLGLFLSTQASKTKVAIATVAGEPDIPTTDATPPTSDVPERVDLPPDTNIEKRQPIEMEGAEPANKVVGTDQALNLDLEAVPSVVMTPPPVTADAPTMETSAKAASTPDSSTPTISPEPSPNNVPVPVESPDLPESMRRMSRIFDGSSLSLLPDAFSTSANANDVREQINVESLYHPVAIELPKPNWLRQSKLRKLNSQDQPLNRLIVLLGQLSGGPIGWDSEHARYSGVDPELRMSLEINDQDVFSVLESQLKKRDIGLLTDSSEVVCLRANNSLIEARLPTDWSMDDLMGKNDSLAEWRSMLMAYFPKLASRWNLDGQKIVWTSDASPLEKAYLAGFMDQIRIAHGVAAKSKLPLSVMEPMIGLSDLDKRLAVTGTSILAEPMSVPQLLDHAARDLGIELDFDWSSLYAHGFSHAAYDTILLRGRNWSETVRYTLDKFALVAVADGPSRIRLTTLPKQREIWRTIIVEVSADDSIEKIIDRFRRLSPADAEGRSVILAQIIPTVASANPTKRLAAIRICPPNTEQLRENAIRRLLGLPVTK